MFLRSLFGVSCLYSYGILLALVSSLSGADINWQEKSACRIRDRQLTLRCKTNQRIMVFSANYGNSSGHNCSGDWTSQRQTRTKSAAALRKTSSKRSIDSALTTADLSKPFTTRCDHDVTSFVKDICSGREVCLIEIDDNIFHDPCDGDEALSVRYSCIPASEIISVCNRNATALSGHILSPGYPEYYPGSDCSWKISAEDGKNILLMLNDLSLRPQSTKDNSCTDFLIIYEGDRQLVRTCQTYPFNIQLTSNTARIALVSSSSSGWTSRGIWLHYKIVGCDTPHRPDLVRLVGRNYSTATFRCDEGFFFKDPEQPFEQITLNCLDGRNWDRSVPKCTNDTAWKRRALDHLAKYRSSPMATLGGATLEQIVIPATIAGALLLILIAAVGIILSVRRHRRKGLFYHNHEVEHLHIIRKAPRAHLDSDVGANYPLTEMRD